MHYFLSIYSLKDQTLANNDYWKACQATHEDRHIPKGLHLRTAALTLSLCCKRKGQRMRYDLSNFMTDACPRDWGGTQERVSDKWVWGFRKREQDSLKEPTTMCSRLIWKHKNLAITYHHSLRYKMLRNWFRRLSNLIIPLNIKYSKL